MKNVIFLALLCSLSLTNCTLRYNISLPKKVFKPYTTTEVCFWNSDYANEYKERQEYLRFIFCGDAIKIYGKPEEKYVDGIRYTLISHPDYVLDEYSKYYPDVRLVAVRPRKDISKHLSTR